MIHRAHITKFKKNHGGKNPFSKRFSGSALWYHRSLTQLDCNQPEKRQWRLDDVGFMHGICQPIVGTALSHPPSLNRSPSPRHALTFTLCFLNRHHTPSVPLVKFFPAKSKWLLFFVHGVGGGVGRPFFIFFCMYSVQNNTGNRSLNRGVAMQKYYYVPTVIHYVH